MYKISDSGKEFIKLQEGLNLNVYPDADGYSVGYGHFLGKVKPAYKKIDKKTANDYFTSDVWEVEKRINQLITKKDVPQKVIDVLADFGFNVGTGTYFAKLAGMINKGDYNSAKAYISLFVHSKDKDGVSHVNPVLQKRRASELEMLGNLGVGLSLLFFLLVIFSIYFVTKK
jgi:GH24 family phage-related lysozyme (muramidase)